MGLIAFPFIVCLICSPFIFGGIIFYMWWEKKQDEKAVELFEKRQEASRWVSDQLKAHGKKHIGMMSNEQYFELNEKAEEKFGVTLL